MNQYLDKAYWNGLIKMGISRLFILRVLYEKPLHGYLITKRVAAVTSSCCAPTAAALYPVLHDFEKGGYLTCKAEIVNGRERKIYSLTPKGIEAYKIGLEAWQETALALIVAKKEFIESGGNVDAN